MLNKTKVEELSKSIAPQNRICGCCYTEFIKAPLNLYKIVHKGKTYHFCSYQCYRKIQTWKENKNKDE